MDMSVRLRGGTLNIKDEKAEASPQHCSSETVTQTVLKMAIYCPEGSGTLRQQLLMMH